MSIAPRKQKRKLEKWEQAVHEGYRSRTQWRKTGRGVKGQSHATIFHDGRITFLYHESQTTKFQPATIAANYLLDRFVPRSDIYGWQPYGSDAWPQARSFYCIKSLVKQGWNHYRCHDQGITVGRNLAQAFSVRCGDRTDWIVIDLDHHDSGPIEAHIDAVASVQTHLPQLLDSLGGGNWFSQYRRPMPTGIQFFVCLNWRIDTKHLHFLVRQLLDSIGVEAEILPSQNQQVSMPGSYPKVVFTTKELELVNGRVDVVELANHVRNQTQAGDVLPRYRKLIQLGATPAPTDEKPLILGSIDSVPFRERKSFDFEDGRRYWTDLTLLARNGVPEPDRLFDHLQPLAQALYYRDFAHEPDRATQTEEALYQWVIAKHNGNVSRVSTGKVASIREQIHQLVKRLDVSSCQPVKDYWKSVLCRDLIYPHRINLIHWWMYGATAAKNRSNSRSIDSVPFRETKLPDPIAELVQTSAAELRQGKVRDRYILFATRLINELAYHGGKATVNQQRLNAMLDKPNLEQRQTANRYKKLLAKYSLIKGGWERSIRRGVCAAKYRLTDEVWGEFQDTIQVNTRTA